MRRPRFERARWAEARRDSRGWSGRSSLSRNGNDLQIGAGIEDRVPALRAETIGRQHDVEIGEVGKHMQGRSIELVVIDEQDAFLGNGHHRLLDAHDLLVLDEGGGSLDRGSGQEQSVDAQAGNRLFAYQADVGVVDPAVIASQTNQVYPLDLGQPLRRADAVGYDRKRRDFAKEGGQRT